MPQKIAKQHAPQAPIHPLRPGWDIGPSVAVADGFVFQLCKRRIKTPKNYEGDFYFLDGEDWVNLFPITPERELVVIRQFRPNINEYCLEVPGGLLDPDDPDTEAAAIRELAEETGFVPTRVESLGTLAPNPAIHANRCHIFVGYDCTLQTRRDLDPGEDIEVLKIPLLEIQEHVVNQTITHAIMLAAFLKLFVHLGMVK